MKKWGRGPSVGNETHLQAAAHRDPAHAWWRHPHTTDAPYPGTHARRSDPHRSDAGGTDVRRLADGWAHPRMSHSRGRHTVRPDSRRPHRPGATLWCGGEWGGSTTESSWLRAATSSDLTHPIHSAYFDQAGRGSLRWMHHRRGGHLGRRRDPARDWASTQRRRHRHRGRNRRRVGHPAGHGGGLHKARQFWAWCLVSREQFGRIRAERYPAAVKYVH